MSNIRSLKDVGNGGAGGGAAPPGGGGGGGMGAPGGGGGFFGGFPFSLPSLFGGGGGGDEQQHHQGEGMVKVIHNEREFRAELSAHPQGLVVVDFFATWCGPCKRIAPIFADLSNKYPNVRFIKVDVDQVQSVAQECGVTAMPTFHFYFGGRKVDELRGADPNRLQELVARHGAKSVLSGGGGGFSGTGYRLGGSATSDATPTTLQSATTHSSDAESVIQAVVGLGFSREAAIDGIQATGTTEMESVIDWVLQNASPSSESAPEEQRAPSGSPTTLAIRLTNGTTLKHEFDANDRLRAVYQWVVTNRNDGNAAFDLMTPYPRKIFGAADMDRTLAELELVPNANLILHRK